MTTYRNVKVKKPGGGYRTQRAMVLASGKLKFVKNTKGRTSATHTRTTTVAKKTKKRKSTTAIAHRRKSHSPAKRSRKRSHGGGKMPMIPLAIGAAGLAYVMGKNGPKSIKDMAAKIPGVTTFGPVAMAGIACLAVDRFVKPNRYLKMAGIVGVVAAALRVGEQGKDFKWIGDDDVSGDDYDLSDVGDDDDVGYDDDVSGDDDDVSGDDDE